MTDWIEWLKLIPYAGGILVFILIAEFLQRKKKLSVSFTRKFVHFGVGILTFLTPFLFNDVKPLIFIAITFIFVNGFTLYLKIFKGMDAQRKTYGTVMFPLSFLILLLFAWEADRYLIAYGIALMTFADGMASVVGEQVKNPRIYFPAKDKKSIQGSLTLFITSGFITLMFINFKWLNINIENINGVWQLISIVIIMGVITVLLENISIYGSDNITLPLLGSLFFLRLLDNGPTLFLLTIALFLMLVLVAVWSYYKKWLTVGGGMAMILIGLTVAIFGNWKLLIPLFLFFVLSSLLSKLRDGNEIKRKSMEEKGSTRDVVQVLANGIMPVIIVIFLYMFNSSIALIAFGAAIAAVTADTWSTEIGFFSKKNPVLITNFKTVPKGSSGGITCFGTLGGLMGAFVISLSMIMIFPEAISINEFLFIALAGFAGSIVDSILGATIQVKYKCIKCLKITEKKLHCNLESEYSKGISFISNDMVNIFCALSSVLIIYIFS